MISVEKLDIFVIVYLDDILIYTKDPRQPHVDTIRWVVDQLRKHYLPLCQPEEISISSGWDLLLGVCSIIEKNKYKSRKNRGYERLA